MGTHLRVLWMLFASAVLAFSSAAYATWLRRGLKQAREREQQSAARERLGDAQAALTNAAARTSADVLQTLDDALRRIDPRIDATLVFVPDAADLKCVYHSGVRAQHYAGLRVRRDCCSLAADAARTKARAELRAGVESVIATDRAAVAMALVHRGVLQAVVHVSSTSHDLCTDAIVSVVERGAAPYAIALERETDRAHATFDALTGLYTPRALRERLRADVQTARCNENATFALWFIDTDHFKLVNDSLGHATGDAVLQTMAQLLRAHTIEGVDFAARNGGDEFCAIVHRVTKIAALSRAQAFCEAVRLHPFGTGVCVTASVGVAAYPYDATDAHALLEAADAAMYHSKRLGRDCVSFCRPGGFGVYR